VMSPGGRQSEAERDKSHAGSSVARKKAIARLEETVTA
jgi:hypothetical protein